MAALKTAVCLLAFLLLPAVPGLAKTTTDLQASSVVQNWLAFDKKPLGAALGQEIRSVETFTDDSGVPLYHVVSLKPRGFVIVSADDLVEPIIAFSSGEKYDSSPGNPLRDLVTWDLTSRLHNASEMQTRARVNGNEAVGMGSEENTIEDKWHLFHVTNLDVQGAKPPLPKISDVRVPPLVKSKWGQENNASNSKYCYNYYTTFPPLFPGRYPCGCTATAMAQLMRFHKFPVKPVNRNDRYRIYVHEGDVPWPLWTYLLGGYGPEDAYDWNDMPEVPDENTTDTQCRAIGKLTYDAGVAAHTAYGVSSSGADLSDARKALIDQTIFGYSNAIVASSSSAGKLSNLINMINPNLDASLPVLLGIRDSTLPIPARHAIICDGYGYDKYGSAATLYHHLNVGYDGNGNIWYNLPNVKIEDTSYSVIYQCLFNIYTKKKDEIISGRIVDTSGIVLNDVSIVAYEDKQFIAKAFSNDKGIYAILNIPPSTSYTVTPKFNGFRFAKKNALTKQSKSGTSYEVGNVWALDFVASTEGASKGSVVDNNDLHFTQGGQAPWFGQSSDSFYGGSSARSGKISEGEFSSMKAVVNGPGYLTFYWKVSSEEDRAFLTFYLNNYPTPITGKVDWQQRDFFIPDYNTAIEWVYRKYGSGSEGSDCGWVDQVVWEPFEVKTFALAGGAKSTNNRTVTLDNTTTHNPTHYKASESKDFTGSEWLPYSPSLSYTLQTPGNGKKTVYFKMKNTDAESLPKTDTIVLNEPATGSIHGKLHKNSLTGPALSGATVTCGGIPGETGSDGTYTISGIPAGEQKLTFSKTGYKQNSCTVTIEAGKDKDPGDKYLKKLRPVVNVWPQFGPQGTAFMESGKGFTPNKTATLHFKRPDGSETETVSKPVNADGTYSHEWKSDTNDPIGSYEYWAVDDASGIKSESKSFTLGPKVAPKLYVEPTAGNQCCDVWFTGEAFSQMGRVTLHIKDPKGNKRTEEETAWWKGEFLWTSFRWRVSCPYRVGTWQIWAVDQKTGLRSNDVFFTVSPSETIAPHVSVSALSGSAGDSLDEPGSWFTPNSTATLHFIRPDGTEVDTISKPTDDNGGYAHTYTITPDTPLGRWQYWALDDKTGLKSNVVSFIIFKKGSPLVLVWPSAGDRLTDFSEPGAGFTPNSTVTLHFKRPDGTETDTISRHTDPNGDYFHVYMPNAFTPLGRWQYWAVDDKTGLSSNVVSFTVVQSEWIIPTVSVNPRVGSAGDSLDEPGGWFTPNSTATLHFMQPDGSEAATISKSTDGNGGYAHTYDVTSDTQLGRWEYWAVDDKTGKKSTVVSFIIFKKGSPLATVWPSSEKRGGAFEEDGAGFSPNSTVTLHFKRPDGTEADSVSVYTNANGGYYHTYFSNENTAVGTWQYWAVDDKTGLQSNIVSFIVEEGSPPIVE